MNSKVVLTVLALLTALTLVVAAEDILQPIGSFSKISEGDGEHANGHQIKLWQSGPQLVGEVTVWDSNNEGQSGEFVDGTFVPDSGQVNFKVTVERHDISPKESSTARFNGRVAGKKLTGTLSWEGKAARWKGKGGVESVSLVEDKDINLLPISDLATWKASPFEREEACN